MRRNFVLAGFCFLALASCGGPPPAPPQKAGQPASAAYLSGQAIEQSLVGRRLSAMNTSGTAYTIEFTPGGTGTLAYSGVATPLTWNIKGDVICLTATFQGRAESHCDRVRPVGGKYEFLDSTTGAPMNIYTPM